MAESSCQEVRQRCTSFGHEDLRECVVYWYFFSNPRTKSIVNTHPQGGVTRRGVVLTYLLSLVIGSQ